MPLRRRGCETGRLVQAACPDRVGRAPSRAAAAAVPKTDSAHAGLWSLGLERGLTPRAAETRP
eukprot:2220976-Rhodomonas_salina.1